MKVECIAPKYQCIFNLNCVSPKCKWPLFNTLTPPQIMTDPGFWTCCWCRYLLLFGLKNIVDTGPQVILQCLRKSMIVLDTLEASFLLSKVWNSFFFFCCIVAFYTGFSTVILNPCCSISYSSITVLDVVLFAGSLRIIVSQPKFASMSFMH